MQHNSLWECIDQITQSIGSIGGNIPRVHCEMSRVGLIIAIHPNSISKMFHLCAPIWWGIMIIILQTDRHIKQIGSAYYVPLQVHFEWPIVS